MASTPYSARSRPAQNADRQMQASAPWIEARHPGVDVVDRPDDRAPATADAQRQERRPGDRVLGVLHVGRLGEGERARQRRRGGAHALVGVGPLPGHGHGSHARPLGALEGRPGRVRGPDLGAVPQRLQAVGDRQRVDDGPEGLGGTADQTHPHQGRS